MPDVVIGEPATLNTLGAERATLVTVPVKEVESVPPAKLNPVPNATGDQVLVALR